MPRRFLAHQTPAIPWERKALNVKLKHSCIALSEMPSQIWEGDRFGKCDPTFGSSPTPQPITGHFLKGFSLTNRRSIFFMRANISAALPTVTTDDKLSCVTTPMVKVGDPPSSRQGDDSDGAQGSRTRTQVFPEAQVPHALRELEGLYQTHY